MQIFFTLCGEHGGYARHPACQTLTLHGVQRSDTVRSLKQALSEREGIPVESQRIIFAGKLLDDTNVLVDYNIQAEATLELKSDHDCRYSSSERVRKEAPKWTADYSTASLAMYSPHRISTRTSRDDNRETIKVRNTENWMTMIGLGAAW